MVWAVHEDAESPPVAQPLSGAPVEVRMSRGRIATRRGRVLDVRASEGAGTETVIGVRWDDDGSVSWLVPGSDIEVSPS